MNDRASAQPPSIYLRDDEAMDQYHAGGTISGFTSQDSNQLDDEKMYCDARVEATKQSGMYRFGKALASAFNRVNVWQGINGIWKSKEPPTQSERSVLQERKIRAEITYSKLKHESFKGTKPPPTTRAASMDVPRAFARGSQEYSADSANRDSAVAFNEPRNSNASSMVRPTPSGSEDLLVPSSVLEPALKASPFSQVGSARRTSMNLRRPSLPSLKKVKSHIQLPSAKRKAPDLQPLASSSVFATRQSNEQSLTRQPSKRDMAKQRKLSKHVSNLESKLEAARRELQLSQSQIPDIPKIPRPTRKAFNPGTLSYLPSEFILQLDSRGEEHTDPTDEDRDQLWTPKRTHSKVRAITTTPISRQPSIDEQEPAPASSSRKRKSFDDRTSDMTCKPRLSEGNNLGSDWSISTAKPPRSRKSRKIEASCSPRHTQADPAPSSVEASRDLDFLDMQTQASAVPVSKLGPFPDATKVDQVKLSSMRSIPNDNIPIGSHLDDIVNLQKRFPTSTQQQIDDCLLTLQKTSPTATNSPNSPDQTRYSKNPSPSQSIRRDLSTIHEAVVVNPSKDKSIPPLPHANALGLRQGTDINTSRSKVMDKTLAGVQKEDYNWPEDVF
ncbi:MAG: hypothetical protein Q9220_005577 [cf. Caloplaca sp. 1 TL-2023]